jgi:hypothetical protein
LKAIPKERHGGNFGGNEKQRINEIHPRRTLLTLGVIMHIETAKTILAWKY